MNAWPITSRGSPPSPSPRPTLPPTQEPTEEPSQEPSEEPKEKPKKEEHKEERLEPGEAPAKFTGVHASNYEDAFRICQIFGVREVAKEFGTQADPVSAAEGYAGEYRPGFRQAVFEGCLAGLLSTQS